MFPFLSTSTIKVLAESLGQDFIKGVSPADLARGKAISERKFQSARDRLMHKIDRYAEENKVGYFQRVIFANALKGSLSEAGYVSDLIDSLVLDAVKRMVYASKRSTRVS